MYKFGKMKIPLHLKIKKDVHKRISYAQDIIMHELYEFFPKAVFHGGTAIWRCYGGNRFSEDIDVYLHTKENLDSLFSSLQLKGFRILKKRIKENSLYSELELDRVQVRFEALFIKKDGILKEYELVDGTLMTVYTLSADELLKEKIAACLKRGKARDLYDIFFLLHYTKKKPAELEKVGSVIISDEENLHATVLTGVIPTIEEMKKYIGSWEK